MYIYLHCFQSIVEEKQKHEVEVLVGHINLHCFGKQERL